MATNNNDWINIFFKYNSGTHNNQWIIFDQKKFFSLSKNNTKDLEGVVSLAEQLPSDTVFKIDITKELFDKSYVASYNTPYFYKTYVLTGYEENKRPNYYTAYRRGVIESLILDKSIKYDVVKAKEVIRFFDDKNLCDNICPRCDLMSENKIPFGGVDGKVVSLSDLRNVHLISGPSSNEKFEKFCFSKDFSAYAHYGIPDCINNSWIMK
jgi:hypothetical protein